MSVEITSAETSPQATIKPPQLEIFCYSSGVNIISGARQYFFPYKTIQFLQLEQGAGQWILHIRTDRDKINLSSVRDLSADFRALMVAYR